jgi:hypothetical protein
MTNRSSKLIGSTLGFMTGAVFAGIGAIYVVHHSLIQLF